MKHRRKVLIGEKADYLKVLAKDIAKDKGFTVKMFECGEDYVECYISGPPKLSITDIVKHLKGITGRKLMEKYPEIRNELEKGELWNHSYFVETIGTESKIETRLYIESQSNAY